VADGDIGQDALQDNQAAGEGDGYPVTGNAELDALLRKIRPEPLIHHEKVETSVEYKGKIRPKTEWQRQEWAFSDEHARTLAYECVNGPLDRDVFRLVYELISFLTPEEIFRIRELGRTPQGDDEDQGKSPRKQASLLSPYLSGLHESELRSCIVHAVRERYADSNGPDEFADLGFFVVRHLGAKPAVCRFDKHGQLEAQTFENFIKSYRDKKYRYIDPKTGKPRLEPAAKVWLDIPTNGRLTPKARKIIERYDSADFLPGREAPEGVLNLWRGWPLGCRPEDAGQSDDEHKCELMLDHIEQNMCGGDRDLATWFLGFLRDMILNPHQNRPIAVLMRGPQGSGKSLFCQLIGQWFGPHYLYAEDASRLLDNFNRHLDARIMVFLDEPKGSDMRREASKLKTLVATETINIERKGFDIESRRKVFRIFAASNDAHIAHIEKDDRRYLILNVDAGENNNDKNKQDYFGKLIREWNNGGREAMFRWLRDDAEGLFEYWDWNRRPVTAALQEQKDLSLSAAEAAIQAMLDDGTLPELHKKKDDGAVFVATKSFLEHNKLDGGPNAKDNTTAVGRLLRELADPMDDPRESFPNAATGKSDVRRGHLLPPLHEARARWEKHLGRTVSWTTDIEHWAGCEPWPQPPKPSEQDDIPF